MSRMTPLPRKPPISHSRWQAAQVDGLDHVEGERRSGDSDGGAGDRIGPAFQLAALLLQRQGPWLPAAQSADRGPRHRRGHRDARGDRQRPDEGQPHQHRAASPARGRPHRPGQHRDHRRGRAVVPGRVRRFFFGFSEHAHGERRGPVPISRYQKTRLTETFPTLPSDSI